MSGQKIIAFLCVAIPTFTSVAMESAIVPIDLQLPRQDTDNGLYYRRETAPHFIDRIRNHHHKPVHNKYYAMIPQEHITVETITTYDAWSPNEKKLALLQCVHSNDSQQAPLRDALLTIIDTKNDNKMVSQMCGKRKYENIAIFPRTHLIAMLYRRKHNNHERKLLIKNLHTQCEQKSHVPGDFIMPNVCQHPTIAFDKNGSRVIIVERLHAIKIHESDATEEYGAREDWRQLYQIVPITVAHAVEASDSESDSEGETDTLTANMMYSADELTSDTEND